ncbi:MAG: glycosyltransferase [Phycisphaerae bacterium]
MQRSAEFAKYLPRFGWQPVVWSANRLDQLPYDETLTAELADDLLRVTRPACSYVARHRRIMRALEQLRLRRALGESRFQAIDWRVQGVLQALSSVTIPDDQLLWAIRSAGPLARLARRERIDAIYSTYSPVSNHLLGWWLQRVTRRPWIADFRDLWTDDYCYPHHGRLRRWIDRRIEQTILERADAVIGVTEGQTRVLAEHVPHRAGKFVCITNGVDAAMFERMDRDRVRSALHGPADQFVLAFAGWFLSDRVDPGFIAGMARFARLVKTEGGRFLFRVVGTISADQTRRFADMGVRTETTGYLAHNRAAEHMVAADVLLLFTPSGPNAHTVMTGKVFEYLGAARPILAVGPTDGIAPRLVRACHAGVCVESGSAAVCAALTDLWRGWQRGRLPAGCASEYIQPFRREHLTAKLADVLTSVQDARREKRGT